jgi:hypothetical protein
MRPGAGLTASTPSETCIASRNAHLAARSERANSFGFPPLPSFSAQRARLRGRRTREKAQKLLDELPDSELEPVVEFLAARGTPGEKGDSFARWLDSRPEEDEEISGEEEAAVQEARGEITSGAPLIGFEEIKREFGSEIVCSRRSSGCSQETIRSTCDD